MNEGQLLLVGAVLVWIIVRRFVGSPVGAKSMVLPLALMIAGVLQIHGHLTPKDLVLLGVEALVSLGGGIVRGLTIKLYMNNGHLWQRYTLVTLLVWIVMIAVRVGFSQIGHQWGATVSPEATVMIAFGFSILVESLVVAHRVAQTGAPIMPRQNRRDRRSARTF